MFAFNSSYDCSRLMNQSNSIMRELLMLFSLQIFQFNSYLSKHSTISALGVSAMQERRAVALLNDFLEEKKKAKVPLMEAAKMLVFAFPSRLQAGIEYAQKKDLKIKNRVRHNRGHIQTSSTEDEVSFNNRSPIHPPVATPNTQFKAPNCTRRKDMVSAGNASKKLSVRADLFSEDLFDDGNLDGSEAAKPDNKSQPQSEAKDVSKKVHFLYDK